jgi:hypothetical protein
MRRKQIARYSIQSVGQRRKAREAQSGGQDDKTEAGAMGGAIKKSFVSGTQNLQCFLLADTLCLVELIPVMLLLDLGQLENHHVLFNLESTL